MVIGLQLPLQSLPLDGSLGKHQPLDPETIQPLSFGDLLKLKEKQLQQEQQVSAASIAAALATMQTQFLAIPLPIQNADAVEIKPAVDEPAQAAVGDDGSSNSSSATQPMAARFITTESSAPVTQVFSNTQTVIVPGQAQASSAITSTTTDTANNPATLITKPVAAHGSANVSVTPPASSHITSQMNRSVQSTIVESPAYSAASLRTTRPTVNPIQPKFEMKPQEVGTHFVPQTPEVHTQPVSDMTLSFVARPDRVDISATSVPASAGSVPAPALTRQPTTAFVAPQNEHSVPVEDEQRTVNIQVQSEPAAFVAKTSPQPEIARTQTVRPVEIDTPVIATPPTEAPIHSSVLTGTTVENTEANTVSVDETVKSKPRVTTMGEQLQEPSGNSFGQEKTSARNTLENDNAVKQQIVQPEVDESVDTPSTSARNVSQPIRNEMENDVPPAVIANSFARTERISTPVSNSQPNATLIQDDAESETAKQAPLMGEQSVTKDLEPQVVSPTEEMPEPVVSKTLDDSRKVLSSEKKVQAKDNRSTAPVTQDIETKPVAQDDVVDDAIPGIASDVEQPPLKPLHTTRLHSEPLPSIVENESLVRDGEDGEQPISARTIMAESEVAPVVQRLSPRPANVEPVEVINTSKIEVKTDLEFTAEQPVLSQTAHSEIRVDVVTQPVKETAESIEKAISKVVQPETNVVHQVKKTDVPAAPTETPAGIPSEIRKDEPVIHAGKPDAQASASQISPAVSKPKVDFDVEKSPAADVSHADKPSYAPTTSNENTGFELKADEDAPVIEKRSAAPTSFETLSDELYQFAQRLTDNFVPQVSEKVSLDVNTNVVTSAPKMAASTAAMNVEHVIPEPVAVDVDRATTPSHRMHQAAPKLTNDSGKPVNEHLSADVPTFDEIPGLKMKTGESNGPAQVESTNAETVFDDVAQVETLANETQSSARKRAGDAVGQVSEKTLPDMNKVEAAFVLEPVETTADEDLQPVRISAPTQHDSGKLVSDMEVVEEPPVAEKAAVSFAANTHVLEEIPVTVQNAATQPVVNTTWHSDEPTVHDPKMAVTETVARSSSELRVDVEDELSTMQPLHDVPTVEASETSMDRKETVEPFKPAQIKAQTVHTNVALEDGSLEAKTVTTGSTTVLDNSTDVAIKVEAKPVTALEQEVAQANIVVDKEPVAVEPNQAHEQPISHEHQVHVPSQDDRLIAYSNEVEAAEAKTWTTVEVTKPVSHSEVTEPRPADMAVHSVAPKVQVEPIDVEAASMPVGQVVVPSVHVNDAPLNAKAVDQRSVNVEQQEEASLHAATYEPVIGKTPVSARPVAQVQPNEEIKAPQGISGDAEARPVEKRTELNQTPISTVSVNGPVNEAKAADFNGKISVGQVQAQAAEVAQQVIGQMKSNLKTGTTSMHLQLNPKELGAIEVDMVSTARGVQVTFFAEQASTGRLLETQLNQLRDSLVDSGVQLSGLNIGQHNTQGQKGGTFRQEPNAAPWPNEIFVEESRSGAAESATPDRRFRQSNEVDYRI